MIIKRKVLNLILCILVSVVVIIGGITIFFVLRDKNDEEILFEKISGGEIGLFHEYKLQLADDDFNGQIESSDERVISVLNGNVLFAKRTGKATIKASNGKNRQRQTIKVIKKNIPEISIEDFGLIVGSSYDMNPVVTINGMQMSGVEYEFETLRNDICVIEKNKVKAITKGEAEIIVKARYADTEIANKTVKLTVNENEGISLRKSEFNLFISENVKGYSFNKTELLVPRVFINGQLVEGEVVWKIADEKVAEIQNGNKLVAKKVGKTTIKGTYDSDGVVLSTLELPVNVLVPIIDDNVDIVIDLGLLSQPLNPNVIFGESASIGKLVDNSTGEKFNVVGNKIDTFAFKAGEYSFTAYNEENTFGSVVNVCVADFVVYNPQDLTRIGETEHLSQYIAIANNIDFGNEVYINPNKNGSFNGTLNGLGHTIKNIVFAAPCENYNGVKYSPDKYGSFGLFAYTSDCTFKNLSMINVKLYGWNSSPLFYRGNGIVIIDNVYMQSELLSPEMRNGGGLFSFCFSGQVKVSNSIIVLTGANINENVRNSCGGICARLNAPLVVTNTHLISDGDICSVKEDYYNRGSGAANSLNINYEDEASFILEMNKEESRVNLQGFNKYWKIDGVNCPKFLSNS